MLTLQDRHNRHNSSIKLFESLFDDPFFFGSWSNRKYSTNFSMTSTYSTDDEGIKLSTNLPGYGKDDLEVFVEDHVLYVKDKPSENSGHKLNHYFNLPETVDEDTVECVCKNGVLEITAKYIPVEINKKVITVK